MDSNTMITINGDNIMINEFKTARKIPIKKFVEKYAKQIISKLSTPELPTGTIKYSVKDDVETFYIHIPMGYYKFLLAGGKQVQTLMPHTLFKFVMKGKVISDSRIIWNLAKKFSMTSKKFCRIPIQNIWINSKLCIGGLKGGASQKEVIENYVTAYFENPFNNHISKGRNAEIGNVSKDQEAMRKDNHDTTTIINRWFKNYDKEKHKLTTTPCYAEHTTAFTQRGGLEKFWEGE